MPIERPDYDQEFFIEAVNFTSAETNFAPRLIEKDYFCTLLLNYLASASEDLVFKGGTCLAKVHADFYRMSEDLDFAISMLESASQSERGRKATKLKRVVETIPDSMPGFLVTKPLSGANRSKQYSAEIRYSSLVSSQRENIYVEVSLREQLLTPVYYGQAKTLLLNPVSSDALMKPIGLNCISWMEGFAEKFRAALTRREVAVRDFFDIDYAVRRLGLQPEDLELMRMVKQKVATSGNDPVDVSEARLTSLKREVESR